MVLLLNRTGSLETKDMEKAEVIPSSVFRAKICFPLSVSPYKEGLWERRITHSRGNKYSYQVHDPQVHGTESLASMAAEGASQCHCKNTISDLWKVRTTMGASWRLANITCIFKTGKKDGLGSYRLVSNTGVLGKIMEQILLEAIFKYMKEKKITKNS